MYDQDLKIEQILELANTLDINYLKIVVDNIQIMIDNLESEEE